MSLHSAGLPIYVVDAFTSAPFRGNPAAVCVLEQPADEAWMQSLAMEMNFAETAFVRRLELGFELRWFTPKYEVDLCGHATVAAAHTLWNECQLSRNEPLEFHTRSGLLTCRAVGDAITLDFPVTPVEAVTEPAGLLAGLGIQRALFIGRSRFDLLVQIDDAAQLLALSPDFRALKSLETRGIIVTSTSLDPKYDFCSRFFAPGAGVDEDPVTGSAHCALAPFWAPRLKREKFFAYQASARGGEVGVELRGDRVLLTGHAVTTVRGRLA